MNFRLERALEGFIYVTFPIALFIGCAGGDDLRATGGLFDFFTQQFAVERLTRDFENNENTEWLDARSSLGLATGEPGFRSRSRVEYGLVADAENHPAAALPPSGHVLQFVPGEYAIANKDLQVLRQHARFLTQHPDLVVTISGFSTSDRDGGIALGRGKSLGQQRAEQVFNVLIAFGAPVDQLIVDTYEGTESLSYSAPWEEDRVELLYSRVSLSY